MHHTKNLGGLLLAVALVAAPLATFSADDMFLSLQGQGIKGESVDARHLGEIEILSYTQSMTGPSARGTTGGGAGAGKACGAVTILKYVDLSTQDLILLAANGLHIARAVITFRKSGQSPFQYYKVTLDDVVIIAVEQSNSRLNFPSPAPPRATEKVSLIGAQMSFEYFAQQPDGKVDPHRVGWDCVNNKRL